VDDGDRRHTGARIRSGVKKRSLEIELIPSTFYLITAMGSVCVINYQSMTKHRNWQLISPFQVHPGLRAPIWKCYHYFEENMTGLAATSVVLQNGISGLPSHLKGKHPGVLEKINLAKAEQACSHWCNLSLPSVFHPLVMYLTIVLLSVVTVSLCMRDLCLLWHSLPFPLLCTRM
jgi:hypothetical protein